MSRLGKIILLILGGLTVLCVGLAAVSAISNTFIPGGSLVIDQIDTVDKLRLEETLHLKKLLGDEL